MSYTCIYLRDIYRNNGQYGQWSILSGVSKFLVKSTKYAPIAHIAHHGLGNPMGNGQEGVVMLENLLASKRAKAVKVMGGTYCP